MKVFLKKLFVYFLTLCLVFTQMLFPITVMAAAKTSSQLSSSLKSRENNKNKAPIEVILKNAKFNSLTEIEVETNVELKEINASKIVITKKDGNRIPPGKITNVKIEPNKLIIDIDISQFSNINSEGTTIATNDYNDKNQNEYKHSVPVYINRNGEPAVNGYIPGASPDNWTDEGHDTDCLDNGGAFLRGANPDGSTKTLKGIVLFVDFPNKTAENQVGDAKSAQNQYNALFPSSTPKFIQSASYGRLNLALTPVLKWYRMNNNDNTYLANENGVFTTHSHSLYIKEAVEHAQADGVDCTKYDIVYIVPVSGASFADNNNATYAYIDDTKSNIIINGKPIIHGVTITGDVRMRMAFLVKHETGHLMGLPDTYTFFDNIGQWHFTGGWDCMGNGWQAPDYFAWHKWKLGWIRDDQVDVVSKSGTTTHELSPLETPGGTKCVIVRLGKYDAYVIEYRTNKGNDIDSTETGVLIYKIDSSIMSGYGEVNVIDANYGLSRPLDKDLSEHCCYNVGKGKIDTLDDSANGITIKVNNIINDKASVTVTRNKDAEMEVPVVLSNAKFNSTSEIQVDTNVQLKYSPYTSNPNYAYTINGTLTKDSIIITKPDGSIVPADKINSVNVESNKFTITINSDQFDNSNIEGVTIGTKAFYNYGAGVAVPVKGLVSVNLSNAKFNGLTEIVAETNTKLTGIAPNNIVVTSGSYTVPKNLITGVTAEDNKITVELDPAAFALNSSTGAAMATEAYGNFKASNSTAVSPSSNPLDADVWNKLTTANPSGDSMWHNLTNSTALHVDPTPYAVASNGPIYKQIGKVKALMIVIDFPDAKAADNTGINGLPGKTPKDYGNRINGHVLKTAQDYYDYLMPRAHDFYSTSSYGQLDFDVTLVKNSAANDGVFTCNGLLYGKNAANNYTPYSFDRGGDVDSYLKDALGVAKPTLQNYQGGPYDVIYVVAVENSAGISYGPTDTDGYDANLWSGRTDLKAMVRIGFDSYSAWRTKSVNHETGHDLGLVDYYINGFSGYGGGQCDPNTGTADYYPMIGHWNLMGYINGPAPDFLAWDKWRFGWIRDDQVDIISNTGTTTHQITPIETPGGTKMIVIPGPTKGIAYVLEYRQIAGGDNTAVNEKSTDPDPNNQNSNWTHQYGTFNSLGILMYKIDFNVPTLNGPLTVVDLYPNDTTMELGTRLDSSVLGATSGIYSYTDPASGVTIKLDKETNIVDTLTVTNNPPSTQIKPVLSGARFIDLNTIEFKTNVDLRGIYKDSIIVKSANTLINGVTINQITPKTIRITFGSGQFAGATETSDVTVSTSGFSYYGASDAVTVDPLKTLSGPNISEAKFNSLTEIQAKSDIDISGIGASNIILTKEDGSIVSPDKITNVNFDAASKILTVTVSADQFANENQTIGATISTSIFSTYKPAALDLQMAKYDPPAKVFEAGTAVYVDPYEVKLQCIAITTAANRNIYATGEALDISGMVVTGTFDNRTTHIMPITVTNITGFDSSKPNDNLVLTVTIGGKTASYNVAIKDKSEFMLSSINIATPASKTEYAVGEKLDISGMVVKGIFTGGIEQMLAITPANISGFDSTNITDNQVLTVTYQGQTAEYSIKIVAVSDDAYYKFLNKATKKVMEVNDTTVDQWWDYTSQYDPTVAEWKFINQRNGYYKIVNKGYLSSGYLEVKDGSMANGAAVVFNTDNSTDGRDLWSVVKVTDGYYKIINKNSGKAIEVLNGNGADGAVVGQNTYTGNDSQLWQITKLEQLTLNSIAVTTPPDKTIYKTGDALDISGIIVKGTYSDGSQQSIIIEPKNITGFDSSKPVDNQMLTVTYQGKTTTFNVSIKDASQFVLQSIEITTQPIKKVYNIGDTIDISGMVVTGTFGNNIKQVVPVTASDITGFDSTTPSAVQVLTVTYEGKTANFNVTIKDPVPVSIAITKQPTKTIYLIGDGIDITGLEVTGTYNDGSTQILPIEAKDITGFDSSAAKDNEELTVTYQGRIATLNVSIKDSVTYALQSIAITKQPTKIVYNVGDALDISGLEVTGSYSDNSTQILPVTTDNITGFNSSTAADSQILTVTYEGKTATYAIKILAPFNPDTTTPTYYKIINKDSGNVVSIDTSNPQLEGIIQGTDQITWKFEDKGNGYYKIGDANSKYIDIWGGGSAAGTQMLLWGAYSGDDSEYWSIVPVDETYYKIINKKSGLVLDTNGNFVIQNPYSAISTQLWKIEKQ